MNKTKKQTTTKVEYPRNSERMCSMDVKEIHEMLKKTLSPEDYIKLLELMMKDVEKMIEWGEKSKKGENE